MGDLNNSVKSIWFQHMLKTQSRVNIRTNYLTNSLTIRTWWIPNKATGFFFIQGSLRNEKLHTASNRLKRIVFKHMSCHKHINHCNHDLIPGSIYLFKFKQHEFWPAMCCTWICGCCNVAWHATLDLVVLCTSTAQQLFRRFPISSALMYDSPCTGISLKYLQKFSVHRWTVILRWVAVFCLSTREKVENGLGVT